MSKLNLPRVYEAKLDKFKHLNGKPKLSYSQISSWNDTQYKNQYILGYLFGIRDKGNGWSDFGTAVGEYLETSGKKVSELLNENDIKILDEQIKVLSGLKDAEYEREIVLDLKEFCIQGFIDLYYKTVDKKTDMANAVDFKTLNIAKKKAFYESEDYQQTTLYAYALEKEGEKIANSGVMGFDRTFEGTFEEPILHLSGETIIIPTPYSKKRAEKFIVKAKKTAQEISSLKNTYDKLKGITFEI